MKILAADDEILQLNKLERAIAKAVPSAEIVAFSDSTALLEQIKSGNTADTNVAFLDIEMGAVSGIRIAKKLQAVNSKINIVERAAMFPSLQPSRRYARRSTTCAIPCPSRKAERKSKRGASVILT